MQKILKNEKGSISLFVLLSALFFLVVVTSVGVSFKNKERSIDSENSIINNRRETIMKRKPSKEPSFEEKLSEIMQTIPGEKETILPDLSAIFGGVGYEREVEDDEQYNLYLKVKEEVSREAEELYKKEDLNWGNYPN